MERKVIFIPGVGADERAFSQLEIKGAFKKVYANWIPLQSSGMSFESYCIRLTEHYKIDREDILIGLSFGGLVAQQIGRTLENQHVILLSSFRNRKDLRNIWNLALRMKLYKLLPSQKIRFIVDVASLFLHTWRRRSGSVLKEMLSDADFKLIKWSLRMIERSDLSDSYKSGYLSLVGDKDLLIKQWSDSQMKINGGSHFMVHDKADLVAKQIENYLNSTS